MNRDEHDRLQQSKRDQSWQRYHDGRWPDLNDRYDVTVALVRGGPAVLDVGCGQGLLLHLLGERRPDVTYLVGVDSWQDMIDEAHGRISNIAELWTYEADEMPFPDAEFDTVVLGQVLEHVWDAQAAALEALRVLRPGGRLIVNVPADDQEPHGLHVRTFQSPEEVKGLFTPRVEWQGWGRLHRFWFLWGEKR